VTVTYRSFAEALAIANADTRSRHTGADISKASYFYHRNAVITASRMGATGVAKNLYNATRPDLATGEELDELAAVFGITRKKATTAIQIDATVPVTGAGTWAAGMAATTAAGLAFETAWAGAWTVAGTPTLVWNSTTTGTSNNLPIGAEMTITAPAAGMESTATVIGGAEILAIDAESDSALQQRLSDLFAAVATSGNEGAFWEWVLDDDCGRQLDSADLPPMQEAYIYPQIRGVLTVEAVPLVQWNGLTKLHALAGMVEVETYVDTVKAIGTDFDSVRVSAQGVAPFVTLTTDEGYGRDWGTLATTSMNLDNAATHTTTRLEMAASPSDENLEAGHWIITHVGTNHFPNVRQVAAVSNAGAASYVDVTEAFTDETGQETVGGSALEVRVIRPAGPISQTCVDAVLDLFSQMTPSDTAAVVRFPKVDQAHPEDLTDWMFQRAIIDASNRVTDVTVGVGATASTAASLVAGVLVAYILEPNYGADDWLRIKFSNLNS